MDGKMKQLHLDCY